MRLLPDLARLYLAMAQSSDGDFSYAEREAVVDNLHRHYPDTDRAEIQNVVLEVLTAYADDLSLYATTLAALRVLREVLSPAQQTAVLQDLVRIARADGVVLDGERELLTAVAESWRLPLPREAHDPPPARDADAADALHHLAFLYLVLAHATDHDFSEGERLLILKNLRRWRPDLDERQVRAVLDQALERYAHGLDPDRLDESVEAVRLAFPISERRNALADLTQIANADGVFLDSEEDFLNRLKTAWEV